jgi:hypothetical protein
MCFFNSGTVPVLLQGFDVSRSVAIVSLTVSINKILVSITILQVAVSFRSLPCVVGIAKNPRSVTLGHDCERNTLIMVVPIRRL